MAGSGGGGAVEVALVAVGCGMDCADPVRLMEMGAGAGCFAPRFAFAGGW